MPRVPHVRPASRRSRSCGLRVILAVLALVALVPLGGTVVARAAGTTITTVAGSGVGAGFGGDGGPATSAALNWPQGIAATVDGGLLIADTQNNRVRAVSPSATITTVAGNGTSGFAGDGGPASAASLAQPFGVAVTPDGEVLVADTSNNRIRKIGLDGRITTVAGSGVRGDGGDGGRATGAMLAFPHAVSPTPDGGFLIADTSNSRIRKVDASGVITTVAGTGVAGFSGDGGPASQAQIARPTDVASTSDGGYLVADQANNRIRRVDALGIITTVAGNGVQGFAGDSGPATAASLAQPQHVAAEPGGGFLIGDFGNNRVRRVAPDGTIASLTSGAAGFAGDGGDPMAASISGPEGVAALPGGAVAFADANNHRVRRIGIARATTSLSYTGPVSGYRGGSARVAAHLLDDAGAPVAGAALLFEFGGRTVTAITNATGDAVADLTLDMPAGSGTLTVGFAGTAAYAASAASAPFEVRLQPTTITYAGPVNAQAGQDVVLRATLTRPSTSRSGTGRPPRPRTRLGRRSCM
jgi:hypothetical protein